MKEIIKYIYKKEKMVGCIVGIPCGDSISIGFSKYNAKTETEPFSKEKAKSLARARAVTGQLYTIFRENSKKYPQCYSFTPVPNFPSSIKEDMARFIDRQKKKFSTVSNSYKIKDISFDTPEEFHYQVDDRFFNVFNEMVKNAPQKLMDIFSIPPDTKWSKSVLRSLGSQENSNW